MKLYRIFAIIMALVTVICVFAGCKDSTSSAESTTGYEYTPSSKDEVTTASSAAQEKIEINKNWQKNFKVEYEYYNPEQSLTTMKIKEMKASKAFTVEYVDTSSVLYYKENGKDTDYYVLIDGEENQAHEVLEGKSISSLSSMFMKLTEVDASLPTKSNVLYMYDEEVAGRMCHKYIQRAYADGTLKESVYVWIDAEYGFAAKCEAYDATNNLTVMWRMTSFETGTLTNEDVYIDISQYSFGETVG